MMIQTHLLFYPANNLPPVRPLVAAVIEQMRAAAQGRPIVGVHNRVDDGWSYKDDVFIVNTALANLGFARQIKTWRKCCARRQFDNEDVTDEKLKDRMEMLVRDHKAMRLYICLFKEFDELLPPADDPEYLTFLQLRKRLRYYAGRSEEKGFPNSPFWFPGDEILVVSTTKNLKVKLGLLRKDCKRWALAFNVAGIHWIAVLMIRQESSKWRPYVADSKGPT
ncbi:unnamed protein product [Trichogramma brassicae]|uniref:Uncharacterized protein n=1 Tax=Trichogramma brassicae TaxID=86971 RepID=A0A6H5IDT4_9HYME|nr:unnamed protein product [Trichogramma brassicae]